MREVAFIKKAWEDKLVMDTSLINKAVLNATYNAGRGKKKAMPLWQKKPRTVDKKEAQAEFKQIAESEQQKGFVWIKKILGRR